MTTPINISFIDLLNEANQKFTPHFFPDESISNIPNIEKQKKTIMDKLSNLKSQFLQSIQPTGQMSKKTVDEINKEYELFNKDIEARNQILNKDASLKERIEELEKQIKANEMKQILLDDELKKEKEKMKEQPTISPSATVDTSDPGVILRTNKDVATMKVTRPENK
jgi:hypothetical protein